MERNSNSKRGGREIGLAEAVVEESTAMGSLVEVSEDVPVFMDWKKYSFMFPVMMQVDEYSVRLGWFCLAKSRYGFLSKMVESEKAFQPEIGPQIEALIDEVKRVFPGAKDLKNLNDFFTIADSEVTIIGLARGLGAPELLTSDTAPFFFGHLSEEVRGRILERIKKRSGPTPKRLQPALGFPIPSSNNGEDF